ncbi:DUF948 domain-containing protein [Bacillus sp. PS06]|uniref:DUF948 domain-containing protein n=1 Tax=Bacillus sp. PS06 TaxID=2764176 RepID=UPI00177CE186|nr:DUF948 domain-containing protein [Bacillus sp. PS06]MBD8069003.1 DUF948 domain-containing protein [Bacillus sp. PS06]
MIIIVYISAAIIALGFLVLVIYLVKTLKSLQITLTRVAGTLTGLEKQMEGIATETTTLLQKTNVLADDLQKKSQSLNSVFDAVNDVGQSIQKFNGSIQNVSESVTYQIQKNQDKVSQVVQWGSAVIDIWDMWKDKKKKQSLDKVKNDIEL